MRSPTGLTVVTAPSDGDPEALVGWCAATQDLMAFRNALRRVTPERWRSVRSRLAESLGGSESVRVEPPQGNAAERDRRGRAAARVLKLQMLLQLDASRTDRDRSRREENARIDRVSVSATPRVAPERPPESGDRGDARPASPPADPPRPHGGAGAAGPLGAVAWPRGAPEPR